jgi:hypothetical protein
LPALHYHVTLPNKSANRRPGIREPGPSSPAAGGRSRALRGQFPGPGGLPIDTDRNLLFGVLALQADLLSGDGFVEACTLWASHKEAPLADLLVRRGWLTPEDRADVERLLERKLKKHRGDVKASLAEVTTDAVRQSLAGVADPDVRQSLAGPTPPQGHVRRPPPLTCPGPASAASSRGCTPPAASAGSGWPATPPSAATWP